MPEICFRVLRQGAWGKGDAIDEKGGRGLADGCMGGSWVMEMGAHYIVFSLVYVSNFFIAEV